MSQKIHAITDNFNPAANHRHFVYCPSGAVSVEIRTSDAEMSLCSVASRVMGALDYGAGPEAHKLMLHLTNEAHKNGHALSLTLTSN